jgi:hypothetical protein
VQGAQVIEPEGVRRYLEGKFWDDLGRIRSAWPVLQYGDQP